MVPAIRSKVALAVAVAAVGVLSLFSVSAHRSAAFAEVALRVRTADLALAVSNAAATGRKLAALDSLHRLEQDSIRVEHEHRLAAERSADSLRGVFAERARQAPDTCGPVIAAALDAIQSVTEADSTLKLELEHTQHDAGILLTQRDSARAALADLAKAATQETHAAVAVVSPSAPHRVLSFLGKLAPNVGAGAAVGVDPMTNRFSKTVGVTAGWSFR